ncbi:SH3 domain containing protein [Acanthamoeba castellanii str. Neff]|uniref:SH3 domain containing protein n=1 Tax=Acanthamoeba castellanii (strain ATCC 30010 / Neff) TaxID=1257118 RepID=L8H372_ACACF|nr:SH3 domain containing protein [Acanthamoeba castellanii str. Neff]ELR19158.1 SH3 domain containing protein [Acanthamoeba castellanii str. Neff]
MDTKIERQRSVSDADQQPLAVGESEGVRVVAMCTFEAVQDYELGFRQYDVLTAIAKAEEIGGKIGLFPSECVEILKGYPDRLPLFKIFLSDDGTDGGIDVLQISNDDVPVHQQKHISPSASTASLVSSSSSTEVDTTPRQRASTHPEPDVAVISCYRCNAQVSIKKGQSFYPCECGANVKRPEVDDEHQHGQEETPSAVNTKRRRCNTAGAAVGGVVREETPKQRKKREKLEREQKKKQDEEERKFRERRDKGRLSASQWNRQVDSARERLWRASVIMTGPNGESTNDDGSVSMLSTDDNISTVGSSAFDVDTFEDARSDSPRDISSFSSALSGRSLSRSGSLTSVSVNPESAKTKRDKKKTKEQRKKEKEEKKRLKKLEKEEREEKRKMERVGREKKRRNSLFGSSSGSIATRKQRDKLTTANPAAADSVTVTINPITAHAKKQQQHMKAKTMVKTKSGKVMSLEEVEREGKKSNWDVSRLFSVRIGAGAGGRVNKQQTQKQRKASVGAAEASHAQVIQRAAQQERELQEAARQLEEERRRFAEERQRFEQERLKVMLMLAQDMEGVKMARDGTPMYPSPANHPLLLVPTEPSPIASFAASQSSFTCLPTATATLSADALVAPHESSSTSVLPHTTSAPTYTHHQSGGTSNSTPSLPSLYNPSLASMPSSVAMPSADDADDGSPSSSADDVDVRESAEAVPASPRKPPSGGVFLPFLMAPRAGGPQQQRNATNASAGAHQKAESEAAAELEEKLLDQLNNAKDDGDDSHIDQDAEEAESGTSSDEEEDELTDEDSTSSEEEVRVQPAVDKLMREKRKITVAPIQGISDMKELDDDDRQQLDGSWITAISPRRRERDQHQLKAVAAVVDEGEKEMKDVIVRPGMSTASSSSSTSSTSVAADKSKKVSFAAGGASSWTTAESPRRMLEALRAQGASQAEIDRERKRLLAGNVADGTVGGRALTPAAAAIATKYEEEIDQLLEKMKQLRDRSSSDDSWDTSSESDEDLNDDNNVDDKEKQKPHDISSDDDDEEVADDDDESEAEVVIPEWTRGPPKSLQEMREYKDFVRARYETEKRETERMLRRNQREMRARGMTLPSTTTSASTSHAPNHADHRASWII